ncbi:tripartite motif-containing protein 16-like protein [Ctenopharyngodon idella]|uniref:tripartite motif-containing protein 16-like protein n=1 Tax=Ctenopharyngodon idella TaxID=7959 RepID=UPI00222EF513|nr:tripartite motif-containing protein 16-like protein [Ctenopharyngodon idella]
MSTIKEPLCLTHNTVNIQTHYLQTNSNSIIKMPSSQRIMMTPQTKKTGRKIKAGNIPTEKLPVYEPNIPEPTSREELLKYWLNISLDERTANKVLWLTEGGAKVSRMTDEVCPYLDRPERFDHSPQVLCKESIWASRCYWEVLYSGWVVIGATYEGAGRRAGDGPCGLGENEESWGLGWAGSCYDAWHKGINSRVEDAHQCCTIGVYVDQPAGLLCFYTVETEQDSQKKQVKLLHRFKNPIKEKILPGFWVGRQSSCLILKKEE